MIYTPRTSIVFVGPTRNSTTRITIYSPRLVDTSRSRTRRTEHLGVWSQISTVPLFNIKLFIVGSCTISILTMVLGLLRQVDTENVKTNKSHVKLQLYFMEKWDSNTPKFHIHLSNF
jgi:hypothetical protein